MTCEEIRGLLSPYADGELDLVHGLEIERHLEGCPTCAAALDRTRALTRALADPALYYAAPPHLRERIRGSSRRRAAPAWWRPIAAAVAAAVLVAVALWAAIRGPSAGSGNDLLVREVVASHIRSLMLDEHRVDVKSSDRHEVKPWFLGKVDVAPEVKDLTAEGFPLKGGRLDYLDDRPAAGLVYERNKHVINVFTWRSSARDSAPQTLERQGYHLVHWVDGGRSFWAVSDLNAQELRQFVELLRR
jgi:anti-sigma factor RsiW